MGGLEGFGFGRVGAVTKKPRSATPRRQRRWLDSWLVFRSRDHSPPSYIPSSDNASDFSPDDNMGYDSSIRRKEFYLNDPAPRISSFSKAEGVPASKKIKKDGKMFGGLDGVYGNGSTSRTRESFRKQSLSPNGYVSKNDDGHDMHHLVGDLNISPENKLRKVKLKVGGVTRTLHAKPDEDTANGGSSFAKPLRSSDASRHRQRLINKDNSGFPPEKGCSFQGKQWKNFSGVSFSREGKEDSRGGKVAGESSPTKQTGKAPSIPSSEPVRKSNRLPKKRVLDGEFDEGGKDEEIHYLERIRTSKVPADYTMEYENDGEDAKKRKHSRGSRSRNTAYDVDEDYGLSRSSKDRGKKHHVEEEEAGSDTGLDSKRKKQNLFINSANDIRTEPLTTRQRALQSGKGGTGASLIEFPNGLPPPPSRKQKEKLSEEEQQAKKAEAAQRRKLQVEKQAKEIEEEAIRKILGLDSDRKKEEKKQKERDEKEKVAKSLTSASNTIRWIMGPTGTIVTFPRDVGLPSIFDSKPCCYPPPREKCAGPSCTNPYKYRDSRSNLPLCSLQCYRAVQGSAHSVTC